MSQTGRSLCWTAFRGGAYALDMETGEVIWEYKLARGSTGMTVMVGQGQVFVSSAGYLYALDAQTGRELWTNPMKGRGAGHTSLVVSRVQPSSEHDPLRAVASLLWVSIGTKVFALNRSDGRVVWDTVLKGIPFGMHNATLVSLRIRGNLLIAGAGGTMHGFDAQTGEQLWHNRMKGKGIGMTSLAIAGEDDVSHAIRSYAVELAQSG